MGSSQTTTTKVELSPEQRDILSFFRGFLEQGVLGDQYTVKSVEKTEYKDPAKVEFWEKERTRLQSQIDDLEARGATVTPAGRLSPAGRADYQKLETLRGQLSKVDSDLLKAQEDAETTSSYEFLAKPPPDIQAQIDLLPSGQKRQVDEVIAEYGYDSPEFDKVAKNVYVPQARTDVGSPVEAVSLESKITARAKEKAVAMEKQEGLQAKLMDTLDRFLSGELLELSPETQTAIKEGVEAAYAPEYAAIEQQFVNTGATIEEAKTKAKNLIEEQGTQGINLLREQAKVLEGRRGIAERKLSLLGDEERTKLMDIAAASGRGPLDPTLWRDLQTSLGKEFTALEAGFEGEEQRLAEVERGLLTGKQQQLTNVQNLTSEQLINLAKGKQAALQTLGAQKAATQAGQEYALQTGLPLQQIATGQQQQQIQSSLNTQGLANQLSILQGIGGLYPNNQTTTQTTTTPFSFTDILGTIVGAAKGAGSVLMGLNPLG